MELEGKVINFLGDSITEGARVSDPENIYVNRLKLMLGLTAANNYGIGGSRIARQTKPNYEERCDLDFCLRCTDMDKSAALNIVMGGTNDFGHGDALLGKPGDRTPDTFWGACHYMMRTLIETYPDAVTVICTPLHRLNEDSLTGDRKPAPVADLKTYVGIIRAVAEYYSLPVLDLYAMSGLQPRVPGIMERYVPDGLHPNDAGHEILAQRIAGFLRAL
jgi:lysophospholipase L1-like esterase